VPLSYFDLALVKTVSNAQTMPVGPGDDITFTLAITNQGNVDAYDIEIVDYIPTDLILNDADWTDNAGTAELNIPIPGPLAPNATTTVDITFTIDAAFQGTSITNYAEISGGDDDGDPTTDAPQDEDSTPDSDDTNDAGGEPDSPADDTTGGDGTGTPGDDNPDTDEDDHDPETVEVEQIFDLALIKTLAVGQSPDVSIGDLVTYNITVANQGTLDAYNIEVVDYVPAGMIVADANWTAGQAVGEYFTVIPFLAKNTSLVITMTVHTLTTTPIIIMVTKTTTIRQKYL